MENKESINELNSALSAKKNEYQMLSDSLIEAIERSTDKSTIDIINKAIGETMDDMYEISEKIRKVEEGKEIFKRALATKDEIENMEKVNLREKYGELYEHLCSAQYIANEIGDSNANSIEEIRVDIGDKLLKQHGY